MKRLIIPVAILLVCVSVITACSSSTPATTQPPTTSQPVTQPATSAPPTTAPAVSASASKPATTPPSASVLIATTPAATKPAGSATAVYGGTMRLISPVSPASPIGWPAEASGETLRTMQLSIETLLRGNLDGTMSPGLVTSYDVVSDPATASFTLHLRKGVKFQDGTDFNAQAVKWNMEQVKAGPANAATGAYWKSFDIIDDYTIRVNFTTWQNRLLTGFGMPSSHMVSPTAFQKNGVEWMRVNMVGTGPFMQTSYQRDVTTKTVKFANYWETGKPYLEGVQYMYVGDQLTRLALFKSGGAEALDLAGNGRDANDLKAAGYNILSQQTGVDVLTPDSMNADSPWSNPKVRQAAEYAIDKVALNNAFGYGYNAVAYQICSPSINVYDPNFAGTRKYDVAKAKQLLTEAGYPNGFKTRIIAADTSNRDKVIAIQSFLSKVGIQCDLEFAGAGQMSAYTISSAGWHNGIVYGYIFEWPNENYGLNLWYGVPTSWNQSLKKPDGWKEALGASLATKEPDPVLMKGLIRMFYDDATVITLDYPAQLIAVTNNVHDTGIFTRIQNYYWRPQDAWLSK